MKVTDVPAHIVVALALILTDGVRTGLTVIVIALLVTIAGTAQTALEVNTSVTTWPFERAEVVKVELLVPVLTPLICHW